MMGYTVASAKELVRAISRELDIPENTVATHDRQLSVVGLRTVFGRGPYAAKMSPQDAANLLIAAAGSSSAKDGIVTVNTYGPLRRSNKAAPLGVAREPFGESLAGLIEKARDGKLEFRDGDFLLVELYSPWPGARVLWFDADRFGEPPLQATYGASIEWLPNTPPELPPSFAAGDLRQVRAFTHRTIRALGALLREESE